MFWSAITHMLKPHKVGLGNTNAHIWISWVTPTIHWQIVWWHKQVKKASSNTPQIVLLEMAYIITCPHSNNDLLFGKKIIISLAKGLANIFVCIILVSIMILQYLQFAYDCCEVTFRPSTPGSTRWLCLQAQMLLAKEKNASAILDIRLRL
jgi:hypothetical protein